MRADVNSPSPMQASTTSGTLLSAGKISGMTWYQIRSCTISGMLRKNSVQASPKKATPLLGRVRITPTASPMTSAIASATSATSKVQPHACSSHCR